MRKSALAILFALLLLLQTGCGPSVKPTILVSGEVTIDGKMMEEGEISFVEPGEVPETLPIQKGRFEGKLGLGEKRVEIRAYREGKIPETATLKEAPKENYIPARFNTESQIKATVSESGLEPSVFKVDSQ